MSAKIKDFRPAQGYILVEPLEKTTSERLSVVTDEFPQLAKVLSIGDDTFDTYTGRLVEPQCKVGDTILHSAGGFETLKFEGKEYRIVHFTKVLAVKK